MMGQQPSDKIHIIDHVTYEKLQQNAGTHEGVPTIRNSKYKKMQTSGFNLLNFLTRKPQKLTQKERRKQMLPKPVATAKATVVARGKKAPLKRRGKTREGGRKKQYSRLKKSILLYRKQKRMQDLVSTATEQLNALCLAEPPPLRAASVGSGGGGGGLHSRRFRPYCNNCTTPRLGELTEKVLRDLDRFQRRAFAQNEIKARAHRRFVVGFREMQNYLSINKIKLAIIAPDCEEAGGEAGLDETIASIKAQCTDKQIPYVFSLKRRQLAYALYKKVPVSCVAILDYDGARDIFAQLLEALQEARHEYEVLLENQTKTQDMQIEEINT